MFDTTMISLKSKRRATAFASFILFIAVLSEGKIYAAAVSVGEDISVRLLSEEVHNKGWIVFCARSDKGDWDLFLGFSCFEFRFCFRLGFFFFDLFHRGAAADYVAFFAATNIFHQDDKPTFFALVFFAFLFCQEFHFPKNCLYYNCFLEI